ncbi:MAG TPA: L-2-amino-thiazoline-4-carboxylic acid hydrolase [Solirubrobacterales bacterium]
MHSDSLIAAGKPLLRRTVRHALVGRSRSKSDATAGRFTRADADRLLDETWERFLGLARTRPREPTLGARQNVLLAALTVAFFRALLVRGVERTYAIELVGDAAWRIYARWGRLAVVITALPGGPPATRLRRRVNLFLRYPFGRPGYLYRDREEPRGRAFDMVRCPIAEYMRGQDAGDLCVGTWCNLDFPLATMWGGHLEREGTLAGGAPACDFRFVAGPGSGAARRPRSRNAA